MHLYVSLTSVTTRLTWCGDVRCVRFHTKKLFIITCLGRVCN